MTPITLPTGGELVRLRHELYRKARLHKEAGELLEAIPYYLEYAEVLDPADRHYPQEWVAQLYCDLGDRKQALVHLQHWAAGGSAIWSVDAWKMVVKFAEELGEPMGVKHCKEQWKLSKERLAAERKANKATKEAAAAPAKPEKANPRQFTKPAEMAKAIQTLSGIIRGFCADGVVNEQELVELREWVYAHTHLAKRAPFDEILGFVNGALADNRLDAEEVIDILWLCNQFEEGGSYYDDVTSRLQQLQGLCHGILADGVVNEAEVAGLHAWLDQHRYLASFYPYDELYSFLHSALQDEHLSQDEQLMMKALLSQWVSLRDGAMRENVAQEVGEMYSVQGVCALSPVIEFADRRFCLTGESSRASRPAIQRLISQMGGTPIENVTKQLNYLVVGAEGSPCWAYSCYGRKIEQALKYRQAGLPLAIVHEVDFWGVVDGK